MTGLGHPLLRLLTALSAKGDFKFFLCFFAFCVVFLVLAYLTNPSESSFRAYLTEQSFRHHLSRLDRFDDAVDDDNAVDDPLAPSITPGRPSTCSFTFDNPALLHFATRASVSLRTPKHVFHSFGVFTVATMLPRKSESPNNCQPSSAITDSWYIGAFGRWWRGGEIEAWYQDVIARSKDEESRCSGILSLSNFDLRNDYPGLPVSSQGISLSRPHQGAPPKLRNRERPSQRTNGPPPRCDKPSPKSVSLPLQSSCASCINWMPHQHVSAPSATSNPNQPLQGHAAQPSSDISPRVSELRRQIAQKQSNLLDLHSQLSDYRSRASQSRTHLQGKVDTHRERRRQEDAAKVELRSRTKSLDDSKRQAEGLRREGEKKLKAAQSVRVNAQDCLNVLDEQITQLHAQMASDRAFVEQQAAQRFVPVGTLPGEPEDKRREIKVTEAQVSSLSQRARDLEALLNDARERLKLMKCRTDIRRPDVLQFIDGRLGHSGPQLTARSLNEANPTIPERAVHQRLQHSSRLDANLVQTETPAFAFSNSGRSPVSSHYQVATFPNDLPGPASSYLPADTIARGFTSAFSLPSSESKYPPDVDTNVNHSTPADTHVHQNDIITLDAAVAGWAHSPHQEHVTDAVYDSISRQDWLRFGLREGEPESDSQELNPSSQMASRPVAGHSDFTPLYDSLNTHGFHPNASSAAAISNPSLIRAFAPSPAERQVLRRALGGISNASLERLPSLGDVGRISIAPSPLAIDAPVDVSINARTLPSWWWLPQNHPVTFSPWDDEEQEQALQSKGTRL